EDFLKAIGISINTLAQTNDVFRRHIAHEPGVSRRLGSSDSVPPQYANRPSDLRATVTVRSRSVPSLNTRAWLQVRIPRGDRYHYQDAAFRAASIRRATVCGCGICSTKGSALH